MSTSKKSESRDHRGWKLRIIFDLRGPLLP